MAELPIKTLALIGIGHIGSSIARGVIEQKLAERIVVADNNEEHRARALELGLCQSATADAGEAVRGADMVIVCTPIGTYQAIGEAMAPDLAAGAIVTDVGSVKQAAIRALKPALPRHARFVPGHPVAGTENSGPDAGFAALFHNRWAILTPLPGEDQAAADRVAWLWRGLGSNVVIMDAEHHDKVLAITSHLPHLIAYTIVGTATDLETSLQSEVIKFSAGGFRDFTRIAGSNPIMWRDIFLNNREAVLEMLQRFSEDLSSLQRAIRWGEGEKLEELFTRTRAIRRGVVAAKQA
ncbi:MAG: prephenate/arogenate dehydrogenase family protein [Proteobacteria bacterium]|nr:prephenate/arogenate dehydrogenase family protein [Pseudomonadota bacterium]MBI3499393.1 prephenate/arogenate dehydrogenase family protein [Pseudomonadota bacterium]